MFLSVCVCVCVSVCVCICEYNKSDCSHQLLYFEANASFFLLIFGGGWGREGRMLLKSSFAWRAQSSKYFAVSQDEDLRLVCERENIGAVNFDATEHGVGVHAHTHTHPERNGNENRIGWVYL